MLAKMVIFNLLKEFEGDHFWLKNFGPGGQLFNRWQALQSTLKFSAIETNDKRQLKVQIKSFPSIALYQTLFVGPSVWHMFLYM